jgi:hypothetical protein
MVDEGREDAVCQELRIARCVGTRYEGQNVTGAASRAARSLGGGLDARTNTDKRHSQGFASFRFYMNKHY